MNGYVLGLAGPSRAGKNTVAEIIRELRPDWVVVVDAFADRLKLSMARMFFPEITMPDAVAWMDDFKVNGYIQALEMVSEDHSEVDGGAVEIFAEPVGDRVSGRVLLQRYGTEAHRDVFGQDFWVDQVLPNPCAGFAGRDDAFDLLVVTDVRFPNEVERIKDCDGVIWRVERDLTEPVTGHVSEQEVEVDLVIRNHGDLDDLRDYVRQALAVGVVA